MCIENGWQRVLILEDDMQFIQDHAVIARLENALNLLDHIEWDVFFPSSNYFELSKTPYGDDIVQVHSAYTAHCYIVNQHYFETLHNAVNKSIFRLLKSKQESDAVDVFFDNRMKSDKWLGLYPMIGFQRPSYSDIRKGVIDYSSIYQDGILNRNIYWR
jgi:glycosyl transferase, family 25